MHERTIDLSTIPPHQIVPIAQHHFVIDSQMMSI